ncbi:MAG TPA: SDR family oxidoreductase [Rhodocyclaceae bacterium]|nr:SDR family oxidoreductase [Rhodocyclaceae bacterium]
MELSNARILLTGATGGLGQALARRLKAAGAELLLAGRNREELARLQNELGRQASAIRADLNCPEDIERLAGLAQEFGVNVLINNAGIGAFGLVEEQPWQEVEQVLATNLATPIRLSHALLPWLKAQPQAAIVNVGSAFGSIPFAGFAAYSAAKAGLRGFSQALRRELADSPVRVVYVAPRAIATPFNSPAVEALNRALGNRSDSPEAVAGQIVSALQQGESERHVGFPERFFAWLNGTLPAAVDRGLAAKLPTIKHHASPRGVS